METVILLLLLAMSGGDSSQLKEKITSALAFYRENRELIAMLASGGGNLFGGTSAPQNAQAPHENQSAREQTEENPNMAERFNAPFFYNVFYFRYIPPQP